MTLVIIEHRANASVLLKRALVALHTGKPEQAERDANKAMEISCDYEDHRGIVGALIVQAQIAHHYGDAEQALMCTREAMRWIWLHITPLLSH